MKITMAHGSGGKTSQELMENIFSKYFSNEILEKMEDAGVVNLNGRVAISTDSFVVNPIVFKGGDIGKLSVCGTVNDILMMGGEPQYITCGFILEEGLPIEILEQIVASMAATAKEANVKIIAGDTKVVEGNGGMYINTTGVGIIPEGRDVSASNCKEGDQIILSGTLGDHHATILSARMNIENSIESDCGVLKDITDSLFNENIHVKTMRDVTRGGLGTILNEIANSSKCEIILDEESIPVSTEVRGFSDILGLDPLYMGNEGKMIIIVSKEEANKALEAIKKTNHGKYAETIGEVISGKARVSMRTNLGALRKVDVLFGEGLPRIC